MDLAYYVANQLGGAKKAGKEWKCKCPIHDDREPSLYISTGNKQELILKCHAGCDQSAVFNYVKNAGLLPEIKKEQKEPIADSKKVEIEKYVYTSIDGEILFEKVRYYPKSFAAFHFDEKGNRVTGSNGKSKTLYMLHTLKDISGQKVVIVEGEKDCNYVINNYGMICTSPPNGVSSWDSSFNHYFLGAHVVICPDNDAPGKEFAEKVKEELKGIASKVTIINIPSGKDVSDWGGNAAQFSALINNANKSLFIDADFLADNAKAPNYLINKILETDSHGMLAGASQAFKSFMALAIAHSICCGVEFFGHKSFGSHKVVYICGEGRQALARRIKAVKIVHGGFNGNMHILERKIRIDNEDDIRSVSVEIQEIRPALVIFDTFSSMNSRTNENDNSEVANVLSMINRHISNGFTSSLIVHHFGKNREQGLRGASAFTANSDFIITMERPDDESMAVVMSSYKTKDGDNFKDICAEAKVVNIGIKDQDGGESTSLILVSQNLNEAPMASIDKRLNDIYDSLLVTDSLKFKGKIGVCRRLFLDKIEVILGVKREAASVYLSRFVAAELSEIYNGINRIVYKKR